MAIKRHKRGNRVYLAEYKNVREGKKVKSEFIRYLGPEDEVKAGRMPKKRVLDRINMSHSLRAGDVDLLWRIAQDLDFVGTIDTFCCGESLISGPSPGKFLTVWAINRAIDPESCTQLERWVPTTDLPRLVGISAEAFTKDSFLASLDFVCSNDPLAGRIVDHTAVINEALYQRWRNISPLPAGTKETVAYDLTSILFFGVDCPMAELGRNPANAKRRQVNLSLLVSKRDKYPLMHFVFNGSRNGVSTVKNLMAWLNDSAAEPGTLIWDRGNVSKDHVTIVEEAGWNLICGVPQTSKAAQALVENTEVPIGPTTHARGTRGSHLYAIKKRGSLYGKEQTVVVYVNPSRKVGKIDSLNEELAIIGQELDALSGKGKDLPESELHQKIDDIVGPLGNYVHTRVKRRCDGQRIEWKYMTRKLDEEERSVGKWLLLSTDGSLSAKEILTEYIEKDFIEKVFRIVKTDEEVEPVRHRLEHRVRAYMFVCVLAYRLLAVLQWKLREATGKDDSWERAEDLLRRLARVERVDVGFGKEVKTWFLNLSKQDADTLSKIGMPDLLKEERRLCV
ncbi:MAG: IS1634 family transposase [Nitrospirota bacterium]